jgi:hypothetical protein
VSESAASTAPMVPCISSSIPAPATLTRMQLRASPDHQPVTPPGIPPLQSKLTRSDSACARSASACAHSQSHSNSHGLNKDAAHLPQPYIASAVQTQPSLAVFKTRTTTGERSEKELTAEPLVTEHHYRQPLAHYAPPCDRVFASKPPKPRRTRTRSIQVVPPSISPSTSPQLEDRSRDAYQSLLDSPVTIPLRDLIADQPKSICHSIEDVSRIPALPQQQATMMKKIYGELAPQEYHPQPTIAVFSLSQALPDSPDSHDPTHSLANDLAPKPNIEAAQISLPELEPSIASLLHPKCTELKKEALAPLALKLNCVPVPFYTRTKSITSRTSVLCVYSILATLFALLPTLFALMLRCALLSYTCFATSPLHRKHRARYQSWSISMICPKVLEF